MRVCGEGVRGGGGGGRAVVGCKSGSNAITQLHPQHPAPMAAEDDTLHDLAPAIEEFLSKNPMGELGHDLRGTGFSQLIANMIKRNIDRCSLEKELHDIFDGNSQQVDAFLGWLQCWRRMQAGRSANQPAAHAGTPQLATLGGASDWTLRHTRCARSMQRAAQSDGEWKIMFFHDSENLVLRPLPSHPSISCNSTSPPPPYSFGVNAQRAIVRNIVAKCFCGINNEAPSDDFIDSVIHRNFFWYYVSKPINAATCPKLIFRISDSTARDLVDIGRVDFVSAMSGKDDAVDKEIERLMAKERNEFRFSKRPFLFVLGSGDRDFAQAVRECSAEGIPVMVLAKQGGITEAHRSNFDFSDDNWKQLMQDCAAYGGDQGHGDLHKKRHRPSRSAIGAAGGDRYLCERESATARFDAGTISAHASQVVGGRWMQCDNSGMTRHEGAQCSAVTFSALSTDFEAEVEQAEPQQRTLHEYKCEIVLYSKGRDREDILLQMENDGFQPDAHILDLVLAGFIKYSDRVRVLDRRKPLLTCSMVVVLLSSEDISNHVVDAVDFTSCLSDELLCNEGVLVRLIPMCADAHKEELMMRLWNLGMKNLASWPDKLKRSISKRGYLVKSTIEWRTLLTLLGLIDNDSDEHDNVEGNGDHNSCHKNKLLSTLICQEWKGSTKSAKSDWCK